MVSFNINKLLSDRERQILKYVVEDYIDTALPVASTHLREKYRMRLSPSSIRYTLHKLEGIGLLGHLHTSSGRIPTDFGYRLYINELMDLPDYPDRFSAEVMEELAKVASNVDLLLHITANYIGKVSQLFGFVCLPYSSIGRLVDLELVQLNSGRLLFILGFESDHIKSMILDVSMDVPETQLSTVISVLRERLLGLTIEEILETIGDRLQDIEIANTELVKLIIENAYSYFTADTQSKIHTSSKNLLLKVPDFNDSEELRTIMSFLEDEKFLLKTISNELPNEGMNTTIGKENCVSELQHCSVVIDEFSHGGLAGYLGVIGPTRMAYRNIFISLGTISDTLQGILND